MSTLGITFAGGFVASACFVGVRLLVLGARRRAWPEGLLGLGYLLVSAGYGGMITSFAITGGAPSPALMSVCGRVLDIAFLAFGLFTWLVFHRRSRRTSAFALSLSLGNLLLALLASYFPAAESGAPGAMRYRVVLRTLILLWAAWTSLRYYAKMKRRLALGLADPVVTDRFRLWGGFMGMSGLLVVLFTIGAVLSLRDHPLAPILNIAGAASGWIAVCLMWLSFMPPRWYCDRVRRLAPAPEEEAG